MTFKEKIEQALQEKSSKLWILFGMGLGYYFNGWLNFWIYKVDYDEYTKTTPFSAIYAFIIVKGFDVIWGMFKTNKVVYYFERQSYKKTKDYITMMVFDLFFCNDGDKNVSIYEVGVTGMDYNNNTITEPISNVLIIIKPEKREKIRVSSEINRTVIGRNSNMLVIQNLYYKLSNGKPVKLISDDSLDAVDTLNKILILQYKLEDARSNEVTEK